MDQLPCDGGQVLDFNAKRVRNGHIKISNIFWKIGSCGTEYEHK
jgi:hypothetical protein